MHCHYKEKKNGLSHPLTAERKTHVAMYWVPVDDIRRRGCRRRRHGEVHIFRKLAWDPQDRHAVTVEHGHFSLPVAPRGTYGPKSKVLTGKHMSAIV